MNARFFFAGVGGGEEALSGDDAEEALAGFASPYAAARTATRERPPTERREAGRRHPIEAAWKGDARAGGSEAARETRGRAPSREVDASATPRATLVRDAIVTVRTCRRELGRADAAWSHFVPSIRRKNARAGAARSAGEGEGSNPERSKLNREQTQGQFITSGNRLNHRARPRGRTLPAPRAVSDLPAGSHCRPQARR
jgi:hypothetical protein